MTKYGVDLYLNSHTHQYFRLKKQMDFENHTGQQALKDPLFIITGADGAQKLEGEEGHIYSRVMADYMYTEEDDPNFQSAYLDMITTPTKITGQLIRSSDQTILDSFELPKADRSSVGARKELKSAQELVSTLISTY